MIPVDTNEIVFFSLVPEQRIPLAIDGEDIGAAHMAVRLFIGAGYDLRRMAAHGAVGQYPAQTGGTLAACGPALEFEIGDVGNEVADALAQQGNGDGYPVVFWKHPLADEVITELYRQLPRSDEIHC